VRLDLQVLNEQRSSKKLLAEAWLPRNQGTPRTIWLWVDVHTKEIFKNKYATSSLFQVGSSLVVLENTHQQGAEHNNLPQRIDESIFASAMIGEWEPAGLGTYTLVTGGYELRAEIKLIDWGDDWEGEDGQWWLLTLCNVRLLGTSEQSSIHESIQHHGKVSL